jgi:hypothetical protein
LEPERPLSYGNITTFSIFHLPGARVCAIVDHGMGAGLRSSLRPTCRPQHVTKDHSHGWHEEEGQEEEGREEVLIRAFF